MLARGTNLARFDRFLSRCSAPLHRLICRSCLISQPVKAETQPKSPTLAEMIEMKNLSSLVPDNENSILKEAPC
jgi:hypothetical protein